MENNPQYQKHRDSTLNLYKNINSIFSPAMQTRVVFSAEGFNHIIFKSARKERERSSQILRFKLLPLAVKLISLSTTYQEYEESFSEITIKRRKGKIKVIKIVKYWGIIAIIDGQKIKVILRKLSDQGLINFWSIIPAWTTNKYRDIKFYTAMKGDPSQD